MNFIHSPANTLKIRRTEDMVAQTFIQTENSLWQNLDQFPGTKLMPLAEPVTNGSIHRLSMKAGTIIPFHTHTCDEYVYVLAGKIETGEKQYQAGTFWFTPANIRQGQHKAITDVELLTVRLGRMGEFES